MGQVTHSKGSTSEEQGRNVQAAMRPLMSVLERVFMGQMVNPPDTAISNPETQAISLMQGGPGAMARAFGIGGTGLGPGEGTQTRAQLGLPERSSYFTFLPTAQEVASLGAVQPILRSPQGKKAEQTIAKLESKKKLTKKQQQRLAAAKAQSPEMA